MAAWMSYRKLRERASWRDSEWWVVSSESLPFAAHYYLSDYSPFLLRRSHLRPFLLDAVHQGSDCCCADHEAKRDNGSDTKHEIEAAAPVQQRDQRHRSARHHESEKIAYRKDARAPGICR